MCRVYFHIICTVNKPGSIRRTYAGNMRYQIVKVKHFRRGAPNRYLTVLGSLLYKQQIIRHLFENDFLNKKHFENTVYFI